MSEKKYTERDLTLAKRAGFVDGVLHQQTQGNCHTSDQCAMVEYPLPRARRPLRVTLSNGAVFTLGYFSESFSCLEPGRSGLATGAIVQFRWLLQHCVDTPDDMRLIARCLDGETEEVEEA